MAIIKTYEMKNSSILRINFEKNHIQANPDYQRNSEIWTLEKRQLLIDSILNEYDIPKLYLHVLPKKKQKLNEKDYKYAIIDGRQRLETIWSFINGDFSLASDFKYLRNVNVNAGGFTYGDLSKKYPELKVMFDSFAMPIVCVETEDTELIEDMFSRLNEAVPLNAAEKRNAFGGQMIKTINFVSKHNFFREKVKFPNKRYQHKEVATKLLFIEYSLNETNKIIDTKKAYLDDFVKKFKVNNRLKAKPLEETVIQIIDMMNPIFTKKDILLKTQAIVPIYYLLFRELSPSGKVKSITRNRLVEFRDEIDNNRKIAEQDITKANFEMLEFDRMSQQGTNDYVSIKERLRIIKEFIDKS